MGRVVGGLSADRLLVDVLVVDVVRALERIMDEAVRVAREEHERIG
jgi:hypothetical protein